MNRGSFDALSPGLAVEAVEEAFGLRLDGTVQAYPSYVNRVYGLRDEDGRRFVAKFYRPGRWSRSAIEEEHRFLAECLEEELPVAAPLSNLAGETLSGLSIGEDEVPEAGLFLFALFPRLGGRNFEPETDTDWLRLGALTGRLHAVGRRRPAPARPRIGPDLAAANLGEIRGLVHPDAAAEFGELALEGLALAAPRFRDIAVLRLHGDLHRGNILDRPGEGLVLLDFDDMATGPAAQDLWLLLPGRAADCGRELSLLEEGYAEFGFPDPGACPLFEPLRLYRMIHFLAWRSRQREDYWFSREFPDWGGKAFWIKETEDLREEVGYLRAEGLQSGEKRRAAPPATSPRRPCS